MRGSVYLILLSLLIRNISFSDSSQHEADQCYICHMAMESEEAEFFQKDVHYEKGISCAGCHGGNDTAEDMERAMDIDAGFIGVPKGDEVSKRCASCHSNPAIMVKKYDSILPRHQWEKLQSSVHGKLSITGKERIVQCSTCHNAHGIVSKRNQTSPVYPLNIPETCAKCHSDTTFMRSYNPALPVDQLEKYWTSVHGQRNAKGDLKTAECVSCHGSHDILSTKDTKSKVYASNIPTTCAGCHSNRELMRGYRLPSDQFDKYAKSVHGKALIGRGDVGAPSCNDCHGNHGAVPPGVKSISKVCGTCHALNASLFASSRHKQAFDRRKLPECETCHGYHDIVAAKDDLLGVSSTAICVRCHSQKKNQKGYNVAKTMRQLIDSLAASERNAILLVDEAERKGMEISEAKFKLREVHQARLQSRTIVHSFDEEKFREIVRKGLDVSAFVASEARSTFDEYYFRRWGLGIATLIITIVAVSLYLTIRRIERSQMLKK